MKKITYSINPCWIVLLLLVLVAGAPTARAQAPAWQTAVSLGPASSIYGPPTPNSYYSVTATAADAVGNMYLTGSYAGTVVFGGTTLTSGANGGDSFVAKWNTAGGNFVWARRGSNAAGTGGVSPSGVVVSGPSVYVAGTFSGTTTVFGSLSQTRTGTSYTDAFVVKLTDAGSSSNFSWLQRSQSTGSDGPDNSSNGRLTFTGSGANLYLLGNFRGALAFGSTSLTAVRGSSSYNGSEYFLAKLADAGTTGSFGWARVINGGPAKVAVNGTSVYVAGVFDGPTIAFGPTTLTNSNAQQRDIFVTRLLDAGTSSSFAGAQSAGGTQSDRVYGLGATATGAVVTGDFAGPATFGGIILTGANGLSNYEAKWNPTSGAFDWAQQTDYFVQGVVANGTSLYLAGSFRTGTFGSTTLTSVGGGTSNDAFVAKFTDAGSGPSLNWVQRAGGPDDERGTDVAVGGTTLYVRGEFYSPSASFGPISITQMGNGSPNTFLASLTDATLTATASVMAGAVLQLFPNPAHAAATLRLPAGSAQADLRLFDALGREARRYPVPTGAAETTLDLRGLPAGLYFVQYGASTVHLLVD